jgi:putative DNA methylase
MTWEIPMADYRKKLIEVALPLDAINAQSAREKDIKVGKPTSVHHWWSRKPLTTCRAVLFASLVDDPADPAAPPMYLAAVDDLPKPAPLPLTWETMTLAEQRRERLFAFLAKLVKWENSTIEYILTTARQLIHLACEGNPPSLLDPFCGGGSIPLEAQRLGLEIHACDLNPVAALITKALVEIPPKFAGKPPVNPVDRAKLGGPGTWIGSSGLAADVQYYGTWIRSEAERRIGHLYPKATLPDGTHATVISWLYCRTISCPNPACGARMPLASKFVLSAKKGKETWVKSVVNRTVAPPTVKFEVCSGEGVPPEATVNRLGATCLVCNATASLEHVRAEAIAGQMGAQMIAIVAEGNRSRTYLSADASLVPCHSHNEG